MNDTERPYTVSVTVAAGRDALWRALTEPEQIIRWFGWDYDKLDEEIKLIFGEEAVPEPPSRLAFTDGSWIELIPDGERTIVRAVRPGPLDEGWDDIYDGMAEGWRSFFEQLRYLLEAHPVGPRRTLYLTGVATPAALRAACGDGTVWHTSRFQRIHLDPAGHLVAVGSQAPLDSDTAAAVGVVVSTYGLDDEAFAEVRAGWEWRWAPIAEGAISP